MHFQGDQLISRATYVSSRSLMAICIAKIFIVHFSIDVRDFQIAGVRPGPEAVSVATDILIVFLLVNHLLSWIGDFHSFQGWNTAKKTGGPSLIGEAGGSDLQTKLDTALKKMDYVEDDLSKFRKQTTSERADKLETRMGEMTEDLQLMRKSVGRLTWHARLYLFGWFLGLQLIVAGYALIL